MRVHTHAEPAQLSSEEQERLQAPRREGACDDFDFEGVDAARYVPEHRRAFAFSDDRTWCQGDGIGACLRSPSFFSRSHAGITTPPTRHQHLENVVNSYDPEHVLVIGVHHRCDRQVEVRHLTDH